jgi:hypothetical protein
VTTRLSIILGVILIALFTADIFWFGKEHMIFLGKKMLELIEWLAFWR